MTFTVEISPTQARIIESAVAEHRRDAENNGGLPEWAALEYDRLIEVFGSLVDDAAKAGQ